MMISTRLQLSLSILILILFPSVIVEGFTTTIVNSPIINTKTGRSSIVVPTRRPFTTLRCMECNRRKWPLIIRDATNNYHVESDPIYQEKKKKQKKASLQLIQGVHPLLSKSWTKLRIFIHKPTHKAASYIVAVLLMFTVLLTPLSDALAAPSGGRMGGSFGGGGRSRSGSGSGSSYSRSYSAPSRSSYNRGYSRGLNSGYNSRPNIIVAPPLGVMGSSSPIYYAPGADSVAIVRRDSSIVDTFLLYFVILFAILTFKNGSDIADDATSSSILGEGVSVAQISVALNVPDRDSLSSVLTYLNRLSQTAKTDSRVGVSNLVSQVALELLRRKPTIFAASSKYSHFKNEDQAQRNYSSLAIQERSKFERESISKYGGVDYAQQQYIHDSASDTGSFSPKATAAVVTIILSIDGDSTKLPVIKSVADLEQALVKIASDVKVDDCLRSAEVLWTPEDSNDTLSQRDVIADYPDLRNI